MTAPRWAGVSFMNRARLIFAISRFSMGGVSGDIRVLIERLSESPGVAAGVIDRFIVGDSEDPAPQIGDLRRLREQIEGLG